MSENTCLEKQPLCDEMLQKMDTYWRAANYLSAGQLYLLDNPLQHRIRLSVQHPLFHFQFMRSIDIRRFCLILPIWSVALAATVHLI